MVEVVEVLLVVLDSGKDGVVRSESEKDPFSSYVFFQFSQWDFISILNFRFKIVKLPYDKMYLSICHLLFYGFERRGKWSFDGEKCH